MEENSREHELPVSRSDRKAQAKEDVRELAQEIKEDKKMRKMQRHQQKIEEHEKYPTGHLRRKARRLRWKKEKADRRQALKDRYRDAPWIIRIPRLYLVKPFIVLLILAAIAGSVAAAAPNAIGQLLSAYRVSLYVFGMMAAMGVAFGRLICGWMCPFGLFQDLLYKIKVKSKKKNLPGHKYLKYLRYVIEKVV